jgi:hypothetical protein
MNAKLNEVQKSTMLSSISHRVADIIGKSVADIMVLYSFEEILMADTFEPAAFIDVRFISEIDILRAKALCQSIEDVMNRTVGIIPSRIYINLLKVDGAKAWRFINDFAVCSESI